VSEAPPTDVRTDGRVARRERNRDAVIDAVLEMLAEEMLFPTIEQASKRSGLSLRSVYRYFADPGELIEATIKRNREIADPLAHLPSIGEGTQEHRIDDFVKMRLRLYEGVGPVYRATVHNAPSMARIRDELADTRQDLRRQFDQQFASELDLLGGAAREAIGGAGDVLTQLDSIDLLRRHRQLTVAETDGVLRTGLTALFAPRP
jgi:TetR/AcrR family transcriptional regulator of autoinduction and epiphytic fitness